MKITLSPRQDRIAVAALLCGAAYFAGSNRFIKQFGASSRATLLFSASLSAFVIVLISGRSRTLKTRCFIILTIHTVFYLCGALSFKGAMKAAALFSLIICCIPRVPAKPVQKQQEDGQQPSLIGPYFSDGSFRIDVDQRKGNVLVITVDREALQNNPLHWLKGIGLAIVGVNFNEVEVTFKGEEGADAGGLKREFFDTLIKSAIEKNPNYFQKQDNGLALPQLTTDEPKEDDNFVFFGLGFIFMEIFRTPTEPYAYNPNQSQDTLPPQNSNLYIGQHFHPSLFSAILALKTIDDFEELTHDDDINIFEALLKENTTPAGYKKLIGWYRAEKLEDQDKTDALSVLGLTELPSDWKQLLYKYIRELPLGQTIFPTTLVAYGMQLYYCRILRDNWETFRSGNTCVELSAQIQGSINKADLFSHFIVDNTLPSHIQTQFGWLKDWILKEATNEEVAAYLKFQTGVSSNPPTGSFITVLAQADRNAVPFPVTFTCEFQLQLATHNVDYVYDSTENITFNNKTKEGFIAATKWAIKNGTTFSAF